MINQLEPYLKHLGNCGASDLCSIDERCICGLRQVYHRLTIAHTKMQSITRYVQRIDVYGVEHGLSTANMEQAVKLAREL